MTKLIDKFLAEGRLSKCDASTLLKSRGQSLEDFEPMLITGGYDNTLEELPYPPRGAEEAIRQMIAGVVDFPEYANEKGVDRFICDYQVDFLVNNEKGTFCRVSGTALIKKSAADEWKRWSLQHNQII